MLVSLLQLPLPQKITNSSSTEACLMRYLMQAIAARSIKSIEEIGLNGDSIEAEAFAFLGIRAFLKLPISFAKTTGIDDDSGAKGGVIY